MVRQDSVLLALLTLIDWIPVPEPSHGPGRPRVYSDRLFLKAVVIMIVRRWPRVHTMLAALAQPTPAMRMLRAALTEEGRFPNRRTWDRRVADLPATMPDLIRSLGHLLVACLQPWAQGSRAAAIDSTTLVAKGGVWHKKDQEAGKVPHTSIDTEAGWTKSGWHSWVYGWKLHVVTTVAAVWIPLAAALTPANTADNVQAATLVVDLPEDLGILLGDVAYNAPELRDQVEADGRLLVTTKRGAYPHTDDGVEVRRVFHQLRSHAIENWNEQFKAIFDAHGPVPTRGLLATQRWALGAVLLYQLALLYQHGNGADLRVGLKPLLLAA
jgi:hypothetical protein